MQRLENRPHGKVDLLRSGRPIHLARHGLQSGIILPSQYLRTINIILTEAHSNKVRLPRRRH